MQTIALSDLRSNPQLMTRIAEALENGGLVCIPAASGYKLVADLDSPEAVNAMLQAKCRMKNAPALVFVPDGSWVERLATDINDTARRLMDQFWPGPVTLLFKASDALDPKVRKSLTKAKGWLGMRVPEDPLSREVLEVFGRPLLVSSANLSKKKGAHSVAQVKKNFGRTVELLVDAGDIDVQPNSTLVDVSEDAVSIVRPGAVGPDQIMEALAS